MQKGLKRLVCFLVFSFSLGIAGSAFCEQEVTLCKDCANKFSISDYLEQTKQHQCKIQDELDKQESDFLFSESELNF